jgi:very-short-patch-repair endonuclease
VPVHPPAHPTLTPGDHPTWWRIDRRAQAQHGVVTYDQLLEMGLSPSAVQRALRSSRLERLHRGVYRLAGTRANPRQALFGAVAATGPGSAASHRSACAVWDIDVPAFDAPGPRPELTVGRRHAPRPAGVIVHRSLDLLPQHVLLRDAIAVTSPLRLLTDLGAVARADDVAHALAQLLARRLVTLIAVTAFLAQVRRCGRNGCGVLGRVLDSRALGDQPCESVLEELFAEASTRHDLPTPVFQFPVLVGTSIKRIDFAYPDLLVALELDGWEHHGMLPEDFYADRARAFELSALGWQVVPITWRDVRRRPGWVFDHLAGVLAAAARRLPAA